MRGSRGLAGCRCALGLGLLMAGCSYDVTLGGKSTAQRTNLDAPIAPGDPGASDVAVSVRSDTGRHPISPLIYGIRNQPDFAANGQLLFSVAELRWSTYNWENNASNSGYETSQNDGYLSYSDTPGEAVRTALDEPISRDLAVVLVVPIGDRVAADKFANGDVRQSGTNYLTDRFAQNSPQKAGALSLTPDLGDDAVYQDEFVNWVRSRYPSAKVLFAMDEEPDLWTTTMAAARPEALSYAELVQRNVDSAASVKRIWPTAEVLGLTSYGWSGWEFLYDPATERQPADAQGEFIDYYLAQLKSAEASHGRRLIDYLDLHWFSEAQGDGQRVVSVEDATARAARIQAPRSLWDPTYDENSWITQTPFPSAVSPPLGPIALIPRIRQKIAQSYPGTKFALGSWLFGGSNDISGAIAVADTLGILGRENVDLATLARAPGPFSLAGFRIFTNYDGQGSRFGDTSLSTTTEDTAAVSAYAAVDGEHPERLVLVLINKRETETRVGLTLAHPMAFTTASVYQLGPGSSAIGYQGVLRATATNAFSYTMPALTVAVVLPAP